MPDTTRRGVLFDVDGTLVDTTYLHAVCWGEALRQHEHDIPMATVHRSIGMGSDRLLEHLLGKDRDTSQDADLTTAHLALYRQFWGRLRPLPGAAELLRSCAESGLSVVLASSAGRDELDALRSALGADDAIAAATSSSDAESSKPAPDILEVAMAKSGLRPEDVAFVGDAVWDGAAATRAGVTFIGLTCGGTSEAELYEASAVEVWRDPAHLREHLGTSAIGALVRR
ncbi:MAG TPA: HAD family hydrolase [Jatrophihabitantaceae bacterium]|jgi:HAD superfamily hydrolase (TIGR01509 family)|nr:HAD family hydrolase [Jatrophihabitantaceae bacterium]